jgi:hypothetical protein
MKLLIIATALIMPGSAPVVPAQQAAPDRALPSVPAPAQPGMREMPNAFDQPAGCMPIVQQVQEQAKRSRENEFRTLDREPPANLLLAVDRQVAGCREVTFLRRDVAPEAAPLVQPGR